MIRAATVFVVLAGCQTREPPPESPPPQKTPVAESPAPIVPDADGSTVQQHMRAHFAAVVEVQRAIVRGQLDRARESAQWIVTHDEPAIDGGATFVADMKRAAAAVVAAENLPVAGASAAVLGRTCSRCHVATNAVIAFAWEPLPSLDGTLHAQMKRHQWASARLWEGLVGPSDEMWTQGAEALASAELDVFAAARGVARGDVQTLAAHVRELAVRAQTTTDGTERERLYGDLLSTCAGCHQLVRPEPARGP